MSEDILSEDPEDLVEKFGSYEEIEDALLSAVTPLPDGYEHLRLSEIRDLKLTDVTEEEARQIGEYMTESWAAAQRLHNVERLLEDD